MTLDDLIADLGCASPVYVLAAQYPPVLVRQALASGLVVRWDAESVGRTILLSLKPAGDRPEALLMTGTDSAPTLGPTATQIAPGPEDDDPKPDGGSPVASGGLRTFNPLVLGLSSSPVNPDVAHESGLVADQRIRPRRRNGGSPPMAIRSAFPFPTFIVGAPDEWRVITSTVDLVAGKPLPSLARRNDIGEMAFTVRRHFASSGGNRRNGVNPDTRRNGTQPKMYRSRIRTGHAWIGFARASGPSARAG